MIPNKEETFAKLHSEEQFTIRIPKDENNPNYKCEVVIVNGEWIKIPVGEDVKVSKTVRELLINKGVL